MRSAILWDVGGTLVQDAVSSEDFVHQCVASAGIPVTALLPSSIKDADEVLRQQAQGALWRTIEDEKAGDFAFASAFLHGSGASDEQLQQVAAAISRYFDRYMLVPGVKELLHELRNSGIRQGVVSNWAPSLKEFLDHHDLSQYFSVVVGSGEFGVAKPEPAIFLKALTTLSISPGDCIYIGDHPKNDMKPAEMLGMCGIQFDPMARWNDSQIRAVPALRGHLLTILGLV